MHYFAAESQAELNIWLERLGVGEEVRKGGRGSAILNRSMSVQPDGELFTSRYYHSNVNVRPIGSLLRLGKEV